jgi:Fe-S-cluster containining protein
MTFRPRLRAELEDRGLAMYDPLTRGGHRLDPVARAVVERLDGTRSVAELAQQVSDATHAPPAAAEGEIRQLLLLGWIEGACDSWRARLGEALGQERLAARFLEGARFGCQGSGGCCQGYVFGPLAQADVERIEAIDIEERLPHLVGKKLLEVRGTGTGRVVHLARDGDRCVLLRPDRRCSLHVEFGEDAKPGFCRLFPLALLPTIEGLKIYDRGECATFAVSSCSGAPLGEHFARLRHLASRQIYHPPVAIHRRWRCDYGLVLALTARLDAEATGRAPLAALRRIGQVTQRFVARLVRCPIEPGQPEVALAGVLDESDGAAPNGEGDSRVAGAGVHGLALLCEALAARAPASDPLGPPFVEAVTLLRDVARHRLALSGLPPRTAEAMVIESTEEVKDALTRSLRQQIFGGELLLDECLPAGLLRMGLVVAVATASAHLRAASERSARVESRHMSAGHAMALRVLHRPAPHELLRVNEDHAWAVLQTLPEVLAPVVRGRPSS